MYRVRCVVIPALEASQARLLLRRYFQTFVRVPSALKVQPKQSDCFAELQDEETLQRRRVVSDESVERRDHQDAVK